MHNKLAKLFIYHAKTFMIFHSKPSSWFTELVYEEVINFQPKPTVIAEEVEKAKAAGK